MNPDNAFAQASQRLAQRIHLTGPQARGTVRLALKAAGLDAQTVTNKQLAVVFSKVMPEKLEAHGVPASRATQVCEAIAAELFQDVWMKLIRARRNYRPTARFTTYMYQIAHNCLIDHYRRAGRSVDAFADGAIEVEDMPGTDCDGPERRAESLQQGERIRAALAALPDEQREAFVLREEGGLSLVDIAAATGVAAETAKSRLRYAVSKLRRMLADE